MRRCFLLYFLILLGPTVMAQVDTITSRDTIEFSYLIKNSIIPEYQELLNFISLNGTLQNEVEQVIDNRVKKAGERKLFFDEKVIIDSDLIPGAESNATLRGETTIEQYLLNFHTSYSKSDDPTISMTVLGISPIKKKDYLFYNVIFRCVFSGKTIRGESFQPLTRVAEIEVVKENHWRLYIKAIRFPLGNEIDNKDAFVGVLKTETKVDEVVNSMVSEEEAIKRQKNLQLQKLIFEGDNFYDDGKFENALSMYREARLLDFNAKEPKEKISKVQSKIKELQDIEERESSRKARIAELKASVQLQNANYNFVTAKILCDSLIQDFGVTVPDILKLNSQLIELNASLTGVESAMDRKDWKDAIRKCEVKIKETKDSIIKAEFYYRLAKVYFVSDRSEQKKIFEYCTNAINYSAKQHHGALKLRSEMYVFTNQITDAIVDASRLTNNDPRNPDNYLFRATIYEKDNNIEKSLEDYTKAISLKTSDPLAYLNKARIEYLKQKFLESKNTASAGIERFSTNGQLYFSRGLAYERIGDCKSAGKDFFISKKFYLTTEELKAIDSISFNYVKLGDFKFKPGQYSFAASEYSKAIAIDSSHLGLFNRGLCYSIMSKYELALSDFKALASFEPKYKNNNYQMGLALQNLNRCEEAVMAFEREIVNFMTTPDLLIHKGKCEMDLKKYENAGVSFGNSAAMQFSDSVFYLSSLAYYNAGNYKNCIAISQKARSQKSKMYEIYFLCGEAYFAMGNFDLAIKEYEKALSLKLYDEHLFFSYAKALEAKRYFDKAAKAFDKLAESATLKDTALYLSAICLIKAKGSENVSNATNKLNKYLNQANPTVLVTVYAWLAYCYLTTDSPAQANDQIEKAIKINPDDPILNFVLACRSSKNMATEDAVKSLEIALKSGMFDKDDIEDEKLFKNISKALNYKQLIVQYFPKE